jgi:hypothetical protein
MARSSRLWRFVVLVASFVLGSVAMAGHICFDHGDWRDGSVLNAAMLVAGMAVSTSSRLLTLQRASQESGIPTTTLRDLHFRGHLPIVRLPGCRRWWVRREDLQRLIEGSVEHAS